MRKSSLTFNPLIKNNKNNKSLHSQVSEITKCHFLSLSQYLTFSENEALPWNGARILELSTTLKSYRMLL